jgi:hypothetical protein
MKAVKSISEATRLAAQSGATISVGGRTINSAGAKLALAPTPPAPTPAPAPPAPDPFERLTEITRVQAQLQAVQAESVRQTMSAIVERLEAQSAPAQAPRRMPVAFDIVRDEKDRISRVVPIYDPA